MIVVCWKWVAGDGDERWAGVSDPDRTALEIGLRLSDATSDTVTVVSVGEPAADIGLREALATGAGSVVRIDAPAGLTSAAVGRAIAPIARGAHWVVCGDASADRGSGAVPAFLAAELGMAQALGLVAVTAVPTGVRATRRLDGGRREILDVAPPAVLSVEGSVARLRRATLAAELAARTAAVDAADGPRGPLEVAELVRPYRPRARAMAAPSGDALDRVRRLTDTGGHRTAHELTALDPPDAARRILAALREWGHD